MLLSLVFICIGGNTNTLTIASQSINNSLILCLNLAVIYIFWCGILKIFEQCGISQKLSDLLRPIIRKVFKSLTKSQERDISTNICANAFGLVNASLPAGINAIKNLQNQKATSVRNTYMLVFLNSISLQIFPSSMLTIYANAGGSDSAILIFISLFVSAFCMVLGVLLIKIFYRCDKGELC